MTKRFFVNKIAENSAKVMGEDFSHIYTVLRLKKGAFINIFNYEHGEFKAEISGIDAKKRVINLLVREKLKERYSAGPKITAIISLIKNDKMDFVIEKLTELGVDAIMPFAAKRSVVKIKDQIKKNERRNRIIYSSVKQCGRLTTPVLLPVCGSVDELNTETSAKKFLIWEKENSSYFIDRAVKLKNEKMIYFIIGPEGGFEESEAAALTAKGFEPVSIGDTILRAETAAVTTAGVLSQALRRGTWKK